MSRRNAITIGLAFLAGLAVLVTLQQAFMRTITTPQKIVYNGHLLGSSGVPITTAHTVRFSFWSSSDYVTTDTTSTGAINWASSEYVGWFEEFTIVPNEQGYFSVELGSTNVIPDFAELPRETLLSMFIQLEVKEDTQPDTAYEVLDIDSSDDSFDRSPMLSVPFALNADYIDQREIGTASGNIALLEEGDVFNPSTIPEGTDGDTFIIDFDDSVDPPDSIVLQFGNDLGKTLSYDQGNEYFDFNDDVHIGGDLFVDGTINGIDITSLLADVGHLQVSDAGGLDINIAPGGYRLNGTPAYHSGSAGVTLADNAANYLYFDESGLQVNQTGFPTGDAHIPLAQVVTTFGDIVSLDDRRIMQDHADTERSKSIVLNPMYQGASYQGDGSNNVGQMLVAYDDTEKRNYYAWVSSPSVLQDYIISTSVPLPLDFINWETTPFRLTYRSATNDSTDSSIDIAIFDTNGDPVSLSGSYVNLAATDWTATNLQFISSNTWTPGQDFTVRLLVKSKDNNQIHVREMEFFHTVLN